MSAIFRKVGLLNQAKNLTKVSSRNYNMHHHMTPIEVDMLNNNTMNHLPKPTGSWEQLNAKREAVNNATLVIGTLLFLSSALVFKKLSADTYASFPKDRVGTDFPGSKF